MASSNMQSVDNQSPDIMRLKTRPQFLFVRNGKTERRRAVVTQARRRLDQDRRIGVGFTTTKKIGNAVVRNRAKRRLRAASEQLLVSFGCEGVDYVFIARLETATIKWQRLLDDMESALISLRNQFPSPSDPIDPLFLKD